MRYRPWTVVFVVLFSLVTITVCLPFIDISSTSLGISDSRSSPHTSTISVTVKRIDDLLTDNGQFLGERKVSIQVNLEISDDQLLLNGEAVPVGKSSVVLNNVLIVPENLPEVAQAFPIGLVKMEVFSDIVQITSSDRSVGFRRVLLFERIIEVEGHVVIETETTQQFVDLLEDGRVFHYGGKDLLASFYPPATEPPSEFPEVSAPPDAIPCGIRNSQPASRFGVGARLVTQSVFLRVLLIGLLTSMLFLIVSNLHALGKFLFSPSAASNSSANDALPRYEEVPLTDDVEVEENK